MPAFTGMVLTDLGKNLMAKAQTGVALSFTRVGVGDGVITTEEIEELEDLVDEVKTFSIYSVSVIGDGTARVRISLSNSGVTSGFYIREIGLFATDPDLGEILYAYAYTVNPDYLPATGGGTEVEEILDLISVIGNAETVNITLAEPSCAQMIYEDLDLYVATTGDDAVGKGTEAEPFASLYRAIDYLNGFVWSDVLITIHVASGDYPAISRQVRDPYDGTIYSSATFLPINHPCATANNLRIVGYMDIEQDTHTIVGIGNDTLDYVEVSGDVASQFPDDSLLVIRGCDKNNGLWYVDNASYDSGSGCTKIFFTTALNQNSVVDGSVRTLPQSYCGASLRGISISVFCGACFEDIHIEGVGAASLAGTGLSVSKECEVKLSNVIVSNFGTNLKVRENSTVTNSSFYSVGFEDNGVLVYPGGRISNGDIYACHQQGSSAYGVQLWGGGSIEADGIFAHYCKDGVRYNQGGAITVQSLYTCHNDRYGAIASYGSLVVVSRTVSENNQYGVSDGGTASVRLLGTQSVDGNSIADYHEFVSGSWPPVFGWGGGYIFVEGTDEKHVVKKSFRRQLADDGEFSIADANNGSNYGHGTVSCNGERIDFVWKSDGTVTKVSGTANTVAADTDANLCVYQSGIEVMIKNRLGSQYYAIVELCYYY